MLAREELKLASDIPAHSWRYKPLDKLTLHTFRRVTDSIAAAKTTA